MIQNASRLIGNWYAIPLLLLIWQVSVSTGLVTSRLLPGLPMVFEALTMSLADGTLVYHALITIFRALTGLLLATIIGVPFAAAMANSVTIRNLCEPIFLFGYPIPKIALYPVFTYVFGLGSAPQIAFTFLECLYPIVLSSFLSFRGITTHLIWTAKNFGADRSTMFRRVIIPAAAPGIFSGLRIALPVALIVVVLTEMIGSAAGLGYYITISSTRFAFEDVYAAIILIGVCGLILDKSLIFLKRRVVKWERV
jgi:NitT/TauT family transport system permease protein